MEISTNLRRAPLRLTTGAYVLNSGVTRFGTDDEASHRLQTTAAQWVPQVKRLDPRTFSKLVAAGEITLGTALMLPIVPAAVAGLGLSAFSASLLAARGRTNGLHADTSVGAVGTDPTSASAAPAIPNASEAWMLGAGISLLLDALTTPAHDKTVEVSAKLHEKAAAKKRTMRRARKRIVAAARESAEGAGERIQHAVA